MLPDRSERDEFVLWIILHFRDVVIAVLLVVQALVLVVFTIEDFGVPRWAAIVGLAMFPVVCLVVVRWSTKGTATMTSLTLNSTQKQDQQPRARVGSRSPIAPTEAIPRVVEERRRSSNRMFS